MHKGWLPHIQCAMIDGSPTQRTENHRQPRCCFLVGSASASATQSGAPGPAALGSQGSSDRQHPGPSLGLLNPSLLTRPARWRLKGLKGQDPDWCSGGSHVDSDNAHTAPRHWAHASQSLPQGCQTQLNSLSLIFILIVSSLDREMHPLSCHAQALLMHNPKKSLLSPGLGAQGHTSNAS